MCNPNFIISILCKGPEVWESLKYPSNWIKKTLENIEDIYDGHVYKEHFDNEGYFHGTSIEQKKNEKHISFQINTDGVAIFKSSKFEVWPIYLTINELPPDLRLVQL